MSDGNMRNFLFTSESVTEGHPDKIADQISDAVLDEVMRQDPKGRVACETLVTTGLVVVAGEITTSAIIDYDDLIRKTVEQVGYDNALFGFDSTTCAVMCTIKRQSPDIAYLERARLNADRGRWVEVARDIAKAEAAARVDYPLMVHITAQVVESKPKRALS